MMRLRKKQDSDTSKGERLAAYLEQRGFALEDRFNAVYLGLVYANGAHNLQVSP